MENITMVKHNEKIIKEPSKKYIIELWDNSMYEADDLTPLTAAICGNEYVDVEAEETKWNLRVKAAKNIGLVTISENDENIIMYDERLGKIPYSITDPNPDYEIGPNPILIRVESDKNFLLSLAQLKLIRIWTKNDDDYSDYLDMHDVDREIKEEALRFKDKVQKLPLYQRL